MIGLLRRVAERHPTKDAVVTSRGAVTYAELLEWAESAAANLAQRGITRFAINDDEPARVLAVLAGASLAGVEACVYPLAATPEAVADHRERFDHLHLVSSRNILPGTSSIAPADLVRDTGAPRIGQTPDRQPVMVMTTGTSGTPKGVLHEWSRLVAPAGRLVPTPDHRWLLAYGLNQFGGLQILIHVLAARATLVVGDSFQPRDGLAAMRRWSVTHASGTPTFWRFLLAELAADRGPAPVLAQVTLSGEAVPAALLSQIRDRFPSARISQIYAATEFGQGISIRDGEAGLPASLLEADGDLSLRVRDGELFVRSRTAMLGYYEGEPTRIDEWRPTGDLVEVVGDRIEFRGRSSDVINVGGVKVHPLPVEERLSRVPGITMARVFGRTNALVGAIVAVEVVAHPGTDREALGAAIRAACEDLPPAARPRSVKFVDELSTIGNKMTRSGAE